MVSSIDGNSSQVSVAEVLKNQQQNVEQQRQQAQDAQKRQTEIQEQQRTEQKRTDDDRRGNAVDVVV